MWGVVLKSTLIAVPVTAATAVTVAVLDVFGYVARVEGASMQVTYQITGMPGVGKTGHV